MQEEPENTYTDSVPRSLGPLAPPQRFILSLLLLLPSSFCLAADAPSPRPRSAGWPQYRCDSARSGYTPEGLPDRLHLQWTYQAPHPPQPAWPDFEWQRMEYDYAYHPVVAQGMLYYGSSADCRVYALDAATGKERWTCFTDGPVRFAPAVLDGRVFAASDDGYLYCLNAGDGSLLWKRRGGPTERKIIGNERIISAWPARSGPVVHNGTVYFGAGLFPSQGFFLYALKPDTGEPVWANRTAGDMRMRHYTGGHAFSNITGQGYLFVGGDRLLVSTGRAIPGAFTLADGAFEYFRGTDVNNRGGSWTMAVDGWYLVGGNADMAFSLKDGTPVCPKLSNPHDRYDGKRLYSAACSPKLIFIANGAQLKAIDRADPFALNKRLNQPYYGKRGYFHHLRMQRPSKPDMHDTNITWSLDLECVGDVIVAGGKVYVGSRDTVRAVDIATKKIVWENAVEGIAYGIAAAGGRLYVSTDRGKIYCFGKSRASSPPVLAAKPARDPYGAGSDRAAAAADAIIKRSGITQGYCLDFDCNGGRLAYELAKRTELQIIAIDDDAAAVATARRKLAQAGLYGPRVTVLHADLKETHLPNYFANLVVSGASVAGGPGAAKTAEVLRLQRPCGGTICMGRAGSLRISRRGPLPGADNWTHQWANPANTTCSSDTLVRAPLGVLWFDSLGPKGMRACKQKGPAPLVVDGRIYVEGGRFIRCQDAYNGRLMWEKKVSPPGLSGCYMGANIEGSNFCASSDSVYVTGRSGCERLDAVTGKTLARFSVPSRVPVSGTWQFVACEGDTLFGAIEGAKIKKGFPLGNPRGTASVPEELAIFALDRLSGAHKWCYKAKHTIAPNTIAIGGGRVCFIDGVQADDRTAALIMLDSRTGREVWRSTDDIFGTMLMLSEKHGVVVMGNAMTRRGIISCDVPTGLAVFRISDGRKLWGRRTPYQHRPVLVDRTIIAEGHDVRQDPRKNLKLYFPCAWDLLTGEPKMRTNPITGEEEFWTYGSSAKCTGVSACPNLVLFRTATMSYYDLARDDGQANLGGLRPSCFINLIPANGLLLVPDTFTGCRCNFLIRTSTAFERLDNWGTWHVYQEGGRTTAGRVRRLNLNLGAKGDRRDAQGRMWFALPRPILEPTGDSRTRKGMTLSGIVTLKNAEPYQTNPDDVSITGPDPSWIAGSGCRGAIALSVDISKMPADTTFKVRLHFAELEKKRPGERVFDVDIQGRNVLSDFDILAEAGRPRVAVVKEFSVTAARALTIQTEPQKGEPILSGIEIVASNSK